MEKQFESIAELIKDPVFIQKVKEQLNEIILKRLTRPEPKPGYYYVRDWYDRMKAEGQLNADFFLKEIEAIWNKKSNLSSEVRRGIQLVADLAYAKTDEYYRNIVEVEKPVKTRKKRTAKAIVDPDADDFPF